MASNWTARCSTRTALAGVQRLRVPGIDLQPCGGTHVRHLTEIGRVKVLRLRSEGKRNQRVEIGID